MGSNRRHGDSVALAAGNARAEAAALVPATLTAEQVGEVTGRASQSMPVNAWVEFGGTAVQVAGWALSWSKAAVQVKWSSGDQERTVWVWASAVQRR